MNRKLATTTEVPSRHGRRFLSASLAAKARRHLTGQGHSRHPPRRLSRVVTPANADGSPFSGASPAITRRRHDGCFDPL